MAKREYRLHTKISHTVELSPKKSNPTNKSLFVSTTPENVFQISIIGAFTDVSESFEFILGTTLKNYKMVRSISHLISD